MNSRQIVGLTICMSALGYIVGRLIGTTVEEKKRYGMNGLLIGGGVGLGIGLAKYEPADTVNYKLKHKRKTVYHGITLEHRVEMRATEHRADGKVFDAIVVDQSIPRSAALAKEKRLIRMSKPKYNIQHNS